MVTFTSRYGIGEVVYLRLRDEPKRGMVTRVQFNGVALYEIAWADASSSWHYEVELSNEYVPDFAREVGKAAGEST